MSEIVFMALSSGANPEIHTATIGTPSYELKVVVVPDYASAKEQAKKMAKDGAKFIELCGGFGFEGVAEIKKVVPNICIGVVRFDVHPGMNNQSGDIAYGRKEGI
ncbi:MAG: hypothetical protein GYA34_00805 [Chloroflexi bacterium]|nr:hypothetical protein [Chloroflexota bacterium]